MKLPGFQNIIHSFYRKFLYSDIYTYFCRLTLCGWEMNGQFLSTAVSTVPA